MSKKHWLLVLIAIIVAWGVGMGFLLKLDLYRQKYNEFEDRGVPRINITLNGVSLEEINAGLKETKYEGNELTLYNDGRIDSFEGVEVKGRGNTTWNQDKKPYQIKFNKKVDLLGIGKAKKWILLANSLDETHLRNDIAMMFAEMVGVEYNYRGKFVELYVDGEYVGLYYVLQKIEISKGSVDLKRSDGVLFELDLLHRGDEESYETYWGEHLVLKDAVVETMDKDSAAVKTFIDDLNDGEKAIETKDIEKVKEVINIESFAKYFLVNEFTVNPDAYSTSFYLYRDNDGKIAAGPVWDFDLAFGSQVWIWWTDESFFSPTVSMARRKDVFGSGDSEGDRNTSRILYYLMDMPEFREIVAGLFRETLAGQKEKIIKEIANTKKRLNKVNEIDSEKWGKTKFQEEYEKMVGWIEARFDYFEELYRKKE